jgi:hypothetical protein
MRTLILSIMLVTMIPSQSQAQTQSTEQIKPLSMKYDSIAFDTKPQVLQKACAIRLMPAVDGRLNKETLGTNGGTPLLSGDAAGWITEGLMNLKAFGFSVVSASDQNRQAGSLTISPTITRAYTWFVGMKLFGTVVMKVDVQMPNGTIEHKTYRASGDKTNMWGADDEFMTTLNYSLNNLLTKMAGDMENRCGAAI